MRAFMRRQKSKKVASGATSAELEAMMNFPEDQDPTPSQTPLATMKLHYTGLSDFERAEIVDYSEIWYIGERSRKKAATRDEYANNHGYDDERGDYHLVEHDHLAYRYEVIGLLGKGSFGQVLQCRDHATGRSVAIKIIRNKKRFHHQALVEVKILENLKKWVRLLFIPFSFSLSPEY
jgi:dual specificity tyrosine-phosphorylation-regulated kinase 2/3/4